MLCNLDLDFNTAVKSKIYDVVVVGAGQAGLSISYFLSKSKINHVVLDQGKLGNAWLNDLRASCLNLYFIFQIEKIKQF